MTDRIGFYGYAGAGKSTTSDHLVDTHWFERISLADPVKKIADFLCDKQGLPKDKAVRRPFYQWVGEAGRQIDPLFWVNHLVEKYHLGNIDLAETGSRYVVDDIRFPNEADYLRAMCGFTIVKLAVPKDVCLARLQARDGSVTAEVFNHESEIHIDEIIPDLEIPNITPEDRDTAFRRLDTLLAHDLAA